MLARAPTCRLRWAEAIGFLVPCWPSLRAWASSSSNSCCRVASAGSEQPGKNQSSSISFVPQGKGEFGLDWGCIYGMGGGYKWWQRGGREVLRTLLKTGWQRCRAENKCDVLVVLMKREMRHFQHHRYKLCDTEEQFHLTVKRQAVRRVWRQSEGINDGERDEVTQPPGLCSLWLFA